MFKPSRKNASRIPAVTRFLLLYHNTRTQSRLSLYTNTAVRLYIITHVSQELRREYSRNETLRCRGRVFVTESNRS